MSATAVARFYILKVYWQKKRERKICTRQSPFFEAISYSLHAERTRQRA